MVFVGEFFTSTQRAEFNRKLAVALLDEGITLGILHRGPRDWYLQGEEESFDLFEKLEKDVPQDPDFYLCWEGESVGLSETPLFRLVAVTAAGKNGEYACPVLELKTPQSSWAEAARLLKERLENLRSKRRRHTITSFSLDVCLYTTSPNAGLAEETRANLRSYLGAAVVPQFLAPEQIGSVDPEGRLLLMAEGETLLLEDQQAFQEAFFSPEERIVFLEAVSFDAWGLEQFIFPSCRFFRGRAIRELGAVDELPLSYEGRWAPVRVLRPLSLAQKRRERMFAGWSRKLPAYHLHHLLAVDAAAIGRWQEAIVAFQMAYREAPEPYRALVLRNLSLALIEQERYQEAIGVLRDAQELYSGYADLSYLIGLAYWKQKDYDEALREFLAAAEKGEATRWYYSDPGAGTYKPVFLIAEAYKEKGNLTGALAGYVGSLTHNSYFLPTLERLAQIGLDQQAAGEVSELLQQVLDLRRPEVREAFDHFLAVATPVGR
ncbi:tetratricopeptide repeat protein [Thermodesulfitimonas autotrophica]|uniref:Tetratricopeptide repeat protein n=1 Tax=Thermodesulfitimonas autotrophica TaxID=1894989 RepID=A0A3N5AEA9_9THEO|nr:tetratricopeptide repeat protein [Thermodesulfitimonas autotrophica]RPF42903.1 tetratricopeptide repeat protein [Thermodesulfitimonas autotrophica]